VHPALAAAVTESPVTDPDLRGRAGALGDRLRSVNGAAAAASALERLAS
jgi:hypothetical protein